MKTLVAGAVFAFLGVWFALSEGDLDPLSAAVRFGAIGAVPGFLVGVLSARRARRS